MFHENQGMKAQASQATIIVQITEVSWIFFHRTEVRDGSALQGFAEANWSTLDIVFVFNFEQRRWFIK